MDIHRPKSRDSERDPHVPTPRPRSAKSQVCRRRRIARVYAATRAGRRDGGISRPIRHCLNLEPQFVRDLREYRSIGSDTVKRTGAIATSRSGKALRAAWSPAGPAADGKARSRARRRRRVTSRLRVSFRAIGDEPMQPVEAIDSRSRGRGQRSDHRRPPDRRPLWRSTKTINQRNTNQSGDEKSTLLRLCRDRQIARPCSDRQDARRRGAIEYRPS